MLLRPFEQLFEHGAQRQGRGRDLVFDARRNFRKNRALDQSIGFEIAELQRQHVLGDPGNCAAQLAEAVLALTKQLENLAFPLSGQHSQCAVELAHGLFTGANFIRIFCISLKFHTTPEKASYLSFSS